jgi:gas vesicle protein
MYRTKRDFTSGFALGAVAGAAGALLLYKNRRTLRASWWKLRAKADIHRRLRALKEVTRDSYEEIVDDVLSRYRALGDVASYEVDAFSTDLKRRYRDVKERLGSATREPRREREDDDE